jgi:hypothetical protein
VPVPVAAAVIACVRVPHAEVQPAAVTAAPRAQFALAGHAPSAGWQTYVPGAQVPVPVAAAVIDCVRVPHAEVQPAAVTAAPRVQSASHVGVSLEEAKTKEEGRQEKQKVKKVGATSNTFEGRQGNGVVLPVASRTRSYPTSSVPGFAGKRYRASIGSVETNGGTTRNVCCCKTRGGGTAIVFGQRQHGSDVHGPAERRERKNKKKVGSMSNRIVGRTIKDSSYAPLAPQMAWTVTDASFDALQAITLDGTLAEPLFPWVPSTMPPLVSISRDTFQTMPRFPATVVETVIEYVLPGA